MKAPSWPVLILGLVGTILAFVGSTAYRLGAWLPVEGRLGSFTSRPFLAKEHIGAYHHIAQLITEVEQWAKANGIECRDTAGVYFDHPDQVSEDRLKSKGGCVLTQSELAKLRGQNTNSNSNSSSDSPAAVSLPAGYELTELPALETAWIANFKGAPSLGPLKVYPRAAEIAKESGQELQSPTIEIYTMLPDQKIETTFVFPLKPKAP